MGKLAKLSTILDKDSKEVSKSTLALFFLAMVIILLCGFVAGYLVCSHVNRTQSDTAIVTEIAAAETKKIAPKMTYFGEANDAWHYYVDEETDVLYIVMNPNNARYGLTVALNADGTPMTRKQLLEN